MRLLGVIGRSRPFWVTCLVVILVLAWNLWNSVASSSRIDEALLQKMKIDDGPFDILVEVNFKLERYHIDYFQQRQGRVVSIENSRVQLANVPTSEIVAMSRAYWVRKISLSESANGGMS